MNYCNNQAQKKKSTTVWRYNWKQPTELQGITLVVCIWFEQRQGMGKRNLFKKSENNQ